MIKEPGLFSQRYLVKKVKDNKENIPHAHNPMQHNQEHDFPLAYTSTKTLSRQRSSISHPKRKMEEKKLQQKQNDDKCEQISRLQKQLNTSKEINRRITRQMQQKYHQYDELIKEMQGDLQYKEARVNSLEIELTNERKSKKECIGRVNRYKEVIRGQIYWLLGLFNRLTEGLGNEELKRDVLGLFEGFKEFIEQFNIARELQVIAKQSHSFSQRPMDSIFTQDMEELNMAKLLQLHPLIQTFNNQAYGLAPQQQNTKMQRITKRLFGQRDSHNTSMDLRNTVNSSLNEQNQFLPKEQARKVGKEENGSMEARVVKDFQPDGADENYIGLRKGEQLKLLRKIRQNLWIGELGEKIGLVAQDSFQFV